MKRLALSLILLLFAGGVWAQNALPPVSTQKTVFFNAVQTITKIISAISGKSIYLTQLTVDGTSAGTIVTLSTGTGTNCGTGTATIYTTTPIASPRVSIGDGNGVVAVIGSGVDVCLTISPTTATGWVSTAQF